MANEAAPACGTTALTISYDGAPFAGFARQDGPRTVQETLEDALATVLRREVSIVGAGRTDAGVHARGQVVSFPFATGDPEPGALARSLSALCGPHIAVRGVHAGAEGFSARFDAVSREYRYRLVAGPVPPVFLSSVAWHVPRALDVEAMRLAVGALIGEHDFRSFCVAESAEGRNTVRSIEEMTIVTDEQLGEGCLVVRVVGNAFLHSMVRVIVGSVVDVGRGVRPASWLAEALEARRRSAAGPTAPAHGLTLWCVDYPPDTLTDLWPSG